MANTVNDAGSRMSAYSRFRECPKCGRHDPQDRHRPSVVPHTPEHIERTCSGCGYVWRERPVS